jgi:hypothetical protein
MPRAHCGPSSTSRASVGLLPGAPSREIVRKGAELTNSDRRDIGAPGQGIGLSRCRAASGHHAAGAKTVSRKQALETGADIRVERPHSVNGDGYRTPRMARNGAVSAIQGKSERETRLVGWGTRIRT